MGRRRGRPLLYEELSRKLLARVERAPESLLPPIRTLAREFGVALVTMSKAVRVLADQGALELHQGRRIRVRRRGGPGRAEVLSAPVGRVVEKIRGGILEGKLRVGDVLPKIRYYTISEKTSTATVSEALAALNREGLVHKKARRWVVGPMPQSRDTAGRVRADPSSRPATLLVLPNLELWGRLCMHSHFRAFLHAMGGELDSYDVLPTTGVLEPAPSLAIPSGVQSLSQCVKSIGPKYQGSIVIGEPDRGVHPQLRQCLHALLRFRKPVVWVDLGARAPDINRRAYSSNLLYRCTGRAPETEALAMDALANLGHKRVAYIDNVLYHDEQWNRDRIEALTREAGRRSVDIKIVAQDEKLWARLRREDMWDKPAFFLHCLSVHESIRRKNPGMGPQRLTAAYRARLSELLKSFSAVVFRSAATAVIASNDWLAVAYTIWLSQMGVRLPQQLSLVSFDNDIAYRHYPISTVDQGLGHLGYCAAHIIIGDIPMRTDRDGNVASLPRLADRGSLGTPRKGKVQLRSS